MVQTTSPLLWQLRSPCTAPSVASLFPWCTGSKTAAPWPTAQPRSASTTMGSCSPSCPAPLFIHFQILSIKQNLSFVLIVSLIILKLHIICVCGYVFSNVTKDDEGWYHCEAFNQKESIKSHLAFLLSAGNKSHCIHQHSKTISPSHLNLSMGGKRQLSKNVSNDQSNCTDSSPQKHTKMFRSHNSGSICTTGRQDMCCGSRDGLELRPASGKHDGKAGRKCYSRLQAAVQQANCSGVVVQKQPALHSHRSCGCAS